MHRRYRARHEFDREPDVKQLVQSAFNSVGYELRRARRIDADYFEMLTRYKDIAPPAVDDFAARFLRHATRELHNSRAQRLQDLLADFIMDGRNGVFCEFGATDGVTYSNSYFLQYDRGWKGLLAEPGRAWHADLAANRPGALIDHRCVYAQSGQTIEFNEVEAGELSGIASLHSHDQFNKIRRQGRRYMVETISLVDLLDEHGITSLDYLSVDTEGSELMILETFDFQRFRPALMTVEHNHTEAKTKITALLERYGYRMILPEYSSFDGWYVLPERVAGTLPE